MIIYALVMKNTGKLLRDAENNIVIFNKAPSVVSSRYTILAVQQDEINEIIYNENLDKDGI